MRQHLLEARANAEISDYVPLTQGPDKPWTTDEEAEQYARDPKAYILARCKTLMASVVMGTNNILVATYLLPEFTMIKGPGGAAVPFFVSDKTGDEAKWQGRVGLLLAKGPLAWRSDDKVDFGGTSYEIGDWLCYDRHDGRQISINRIHCRRLKDVDVWGSTNEPFNVY